MAHELVIGQPGELVPLRLHCRGGDAEDILGLALRQLEGAQFVHGGGGDVFGAREGIIDLAVKVGARSEPLDDEGAHNPGDGGRNLLTENRQDKGLEQAGGAGKVEAMELLSQFRQRRFGASQTVEVGQVLVGPQHPLDQFDGEFGVGSGKGIAAKLQR